MDWRQRSAEKLNAQVVDFVEARWTPTTRISFGDTKSGATREFRTREMSKNYRRAIMIPGMRPDALRTYCLSFPGSLETFPFGPETSVFKVAGKMFALSQLARPPLRISLKCEPELAEQLRAAYSEVLPGYHLNKRHWNTVVIDGSLPEQVIRDMIEDSYDLVVSQLPESRRRALGWQPDEPPG
jgi:predicted DNA-binding protein (MmcQ/YjbR family)